ncbi:MAG TPA: methylated-DNA--[protein]-cysteine S-methyltransferase [Ardenticatenaceae bacterium]|nr:methylated-DNA--[protein]-cysteine S-methyltransferase [Ardenticatenaceae bacterium]
MYYTYAESPFGTILLTSDGAYLTGLYLPEHLHGVEPRAEWARDDDAPPFPQAKAQLQAYFDGTLTAFDLPLRLDGTAFQEKVWQELRQIPYGATISYGELARRLEQPNAARAVGLANGRNPISIVVPCHRVIGSNGKLVGYGGGLDRKEALLAFEMAVRTQGPRPFPSGVQPRLL